MKLTKLNTSLNQIEWEDEDLAVFRLWNTWVVTQLVEKSMSCVWAKTCMCASWSVREK